MIRIGVCDDSRAFLEQMRIMLSDREKLECNISVELFLSGEALLRAHAKEPFNIVFLDMIMPHITGIEAARALRKRDNTVKIVFLTSTSEFAVESYSVKASNYLLKPVGAEKLYSCINELLRGEREAEDSVTVKSRLASYRVLLSQIEYVEAEGKLTVFNTRDKKRIETLEPLYAFESVLGEDRGFFKCHRSYIVNVFSIDSYTAKDVTLRSGTVIPIARSCQKGFESIYFKIMFGEEGDSQW